MRIFVVFIALVSLVGCTRVVVHKNPTACDEGLRFYRPKPYLFISPGAPAGPKVSTQSITLPKPLEIKTSDSSNVLGFQLAGFDQPPTGGVIQNGGGQPAGPAPAPGTQETGGQSSGDRPTAISIELKYLPDFAEEYSIQLKPGLGIGEMNLQLQDGWNLTSLGVKTDQQTDEIINSVANVIDKLGGAFNSRGEHLGGVYATNVPFGFYEAVIAEDPCGRKQLYGWRYIGFMPFQTCPTQPYGMQDYDCSCSDQTIYGLVWVDGILQFTALRKISTTPVLKAQPKTANLDDGLLPPAPERASKDKVAPRTLLSMLASRKK